MYYRTIAALLLLQVFTLDECAMGQQETAAAERHRRVAKRRSGVHIIGVLQFEPAAKTLLAISPHEATVNELLGHRLSAVRGRAILFCLANDNELWARKMVDRLMPTAPVSRRQ